jgi:2-phosphoglycerate kinase
MMKQKNTTVIRGRVSESLYSKRLLTESLISSGFVAGMARTIAEKVEAELEKSSATSITKSKLREIVHRVVSRDYGPEYAKHYPLRKDLDYDVMVEGEGGKLPYSKGIMSQSLMASGLPPNVAYDAARSIEMKLKSDQVRSISRVDLRRMTYNILREESTLEHAEKYLLWRKLKRPEKPLMIMIGGATGVGKSTIAAEVAHRLGITRIICTDIIRSVMRGMISPGLLPAIHSSSYSVAETLGVPLPEESNPILIGFTEQVSKIAVGVDAVIDRAAEEKVSTLVEGVHVVPQFVSESQNKVHEIMIIITANDYKTHRARFYQRYEENENRPADKYISHFEAIREIQEYISKLARDYGILIIDNINLDQTVELTLEEITKEVRGLGIKLSLENESLLP